MLEENKKTIEHYMKEHAHFLEKVIFPKLVNYLNSKEERVHFLLELITNMIKILTLTIELPRTELNNLIWAYYLDKY